MVRRKAPRFFARAATLFAAASIPSLALTIGVKSSLACSAPPCQRPILIPSSGTVPANAPAFAFTPGVNFLEPRKEPALELFRKEQEREVPVQFDLEPIGDTGTYLVRPIQGFTPGNYGMRTPEPCPALAQTDEVFEVSFAVESERPFPQQLGELRVSELAIERFLAWTVSGTCYAEIEGALRRIEVIPSAEFSPWINLATISFQVDGSTWLHEPTQHPFLLDLAEWQRRAATVVYTMCYSDDPGVLQALTRGSHEVSATVRIPGSEAVLRTSATSEDYDCESPTKIDDSSTAGCSSNSGGLISTIFAAGLLILSAFGGRQRSRQDAFSLRLPLRWGHRNTPNARIRVSRTGYSRPSAAEQASRPDTA